MSYEVKWNLGKDKIQAMEAICISRLLGSGGGKVGSWAMLQDSSVFFMNCLFTVEPLLGGYHGVHF